jgi:hypothetical protein
VVLTWCGTMGVPASYKALHPEPAPDCPFSTEELVLKSVSHYGTFMVAALQLPNATQAARDTVVQLLKQGEAAQGKCSIVSSAKPASGGAGGKGLILDVTLTCTFGVETKLAHKAKRPAPASKQAAGAQKGAPSTAAAASSAPLQHRGADALACSAVPLDGTAQAAAAANDCAHVHAAQHQSGNAPEASTGPPAGARSATTPAASVPATAPARTQPTQQHGAELGAKGLPKLPRRSKIAKGGSCKRGCLFKLMLKAWGDAPDILYVQVCHDHSDEDGEDVHDAYVPRVNESVKDLIYEQVSDELPPAIVLKSAHHSVVLYK